MYCFPSGPAVQGPCQPHRRPALTNSTHTLHTHHTHHTPNAGKRQHLTACTCMLLFHISQNQRQTFYFDGSLVYFGLMFHFPHFFCRLQTGQVRNQDSSGTEKTDPSCSHYATSLFPHLSFKDNITALVQVSPIQ